jgi:hypothetical protein
MLTRTLPLATLIEMITTGAAYPLFAEGARGVIAAGANADLVVLSADPQTTDPADLLAVTTNMTLIAGEVRWCSDGFAEVCDAITAAYRGETRFTASATQVGTGPEAAFDGDPETAWISGGSPEQWIQVEFPEPRRVTSLRLVVAQDPAGFTTHRVLLGSSEADLEPVHEFSGDTGDGDVLEVTLPSPRDGVTVIRILTTAGPSWVAWREIEVG